MGALSVDGLLGPGGAIQAAMDRYEHRPEQLALAREVEKVLEGRGYLIAEAGTGTGKTLAYLVPAALSGRRVVISTATKNLQEQIFFKDIPLLRDRVGLELEAAYLKGRSNYLCIHRFEAFDHAPVFSRREDSSAWPLLRAWAMRTETGDRAELDLPDAFGAWPQLSTTPETCLGLKCPLYEPCFVTRARRRAEQASIVVVNHHLFFADLAIRSAAGGAAPAGILPRYEAVVFDEAHGLEDAATEHFGLKVSSFRLDDLVGDAVSALPPSDARHGLVNASAIRVKSAAEALFAEAPRALGLAGGESAVRLTTRALQPLRPKVEPVLEALGGLAAACASDEDAQVSALARRSAEIADELDFITRGDSPDHVYWGEARGRGVFLKAAPIDVARELQSRLYSAVDTVVFTSATLGTEGRFGYFAARMGLAGEDGPAVEPLKEISVESPFDFRRQAALYAPSHLPETSAPGFVEAVAEEIIALSRVTGGRAFALFTSLRNMEAAHRLASGRLDVPALLQGERPKTALLEEFRARPSVLFAAHSFWEGVDVPGDALSLVIIDKLPFASPGDPLVASRIEQLRARGVDPFAGYQLPEAVIALRQGFGRLIRTREDRGIVAVLDRRLVTRAYGQTFLRSLPKVRRFGELAAVEGWWRGDR
ncbi:MAG TPA: ATP-dependent DNA helicase [Myxococcales bacterium]|nr:ATP-dependent DNA helicase [Myxococcales bacterium]